MIETTLFQDLMNLAQRIHNLADELRGSSGQLVEIIKRYDEQMDGLGQTEGRELCTVCGAALNEDGICPKCSRSRSVVRSEGWME